MLLLVITLSNKYSHITLVLKTLHWLPMSKRIVFKILLLSLHCIHGSAPQYNIDLINHYVPSRSLRSENSGFLELSRLNTQWEGGGEEPSRMQGLCCGMLSLRRSATAGQPKCSRPILRHICSIQLIIRLIIVLLFVCSASSILLIF